MGEGGKEGRREGRKKGCFSYYYESKCHGGTFRKRVTVKKKKEGGREGGRKGG